MRAKKMTVRKIRKEVKPSSADQEAPNINQVWVILLEWVLWIGTLRLNYSFFACKLISWIFLAGKSKRAKKSQPWMLQRIL
jgi:hypothetical protein